MPKISIIMLPFTFCGIKCGGAKIIVGDRERIVKVTGETVSERFDKIFAYIIEEVERQTPIQSPYIPTLFHI